MLGQPMLCDVYHYVFGAGLTCCYIACSLLASHSFVQFHDVHVCLTLHVSGFDRLLLKSSCCWQAFVVKVCDMLLAQPGDADGVAQSGVLSDHLAALGRLGREAAGPSHFTGHEGHFVVIRGSSGQHGHCVWILTSQTCKSWNGCVCHEQRTGHPCRMAETHWPGRPWGAWVQGQGPPRSLSSGLANNWYTDAEPSLADDDVEDLPLRFRVSKQTFVNKQQCGCHA